MMQTLIQIKPRARWLLPALCLILSPLLAQDSGERLLYYAVEDLSDGRVVARGTMGENGIPANLILAADTRFRQWVYEHETGLVGAVDFTTPANGRLFTLPRARMRAPRVGQRSSSPSRVFT